MRTDNVMVDHATNATAGVGLAQYFLALPLINPFLQSLFLFVSIVWVGTQIYFKWFKRDPK
jgi:hypothetical protein